MAEKRAEPNMAPSYIDLSALEVTTEFSRKSKGESQQGAQVHPQSSHLHRVSFLSTRTEQSQLPNMCFASRGRKVIFTNMRVCNGDSSLQKSNMILERVSWRVILWTFRDQPLWGSYFINYFSNLSLVTN